MISKGTLERLKAIFLEQDCVFFLKGMDVTMAGDDGAPVTTAAMVPGFVIDICESYWWIGTPDGQIGRIIAHETAPIVEIAVPGALEIMEMMEGLDGGDVH